MDKRLAKLDHDHVWHPFTPMKQWRQADPLIIERGDGPYLFDTDGNRYIDGVSSLWCNVHGHRVAAIDAAVGAQLDKIAHTTLLGLASPPSIELAAELAQRTPGGLSKTFYSDAGATAVELAFKMAVGYWYHRGRPDKNRFIGLQGAYHGDTTGSMSVGFSDLFHRPFASMVFPTFYGPVPQPLEASQHVTREQWPSESDYFNTTLRDKALADFEALLKEHGDHIAAVVVEPAMQGAAGMIAQPPGFLRAVADLARQYDALLIADEVATGFGRTGAMFACEHEGVEPDIMCMAKGITGGYLPLAATIVTDEIDAAFCGELADRRTLYHGHTYTGNPLACAAALASLRLFDETNLLEHINTSAELIAGKLEPLRDCEHVLDIRQRGIMVGIELCADRSSGKPFDFAARTAAGVCAAMRPKGVIVRPLGDVMILMPIPAMAHDVLVSMLDTVVETILAFRWPS
jgi:adenosylmethionine-8-amino-7-oxononanoate aminotransferase